MIRECQMTENGMRCEGDGELCVKILNKVSMLCWDHFQEIEAHNLKIIRQKIAKEIEAIQISMPTMASQFGYIAVITEAAAIVRGEVV